MNCRECLEELATGSLRDLTSDSAVSRHAANCPDCGPLLTHLRDREYEAATVLNGLPPLDNPVVVAETARRLAHRRRIGRIAATICAIVLGISVWFTADTMISDVTRSSLNQIALLRTETFPLTCLAPEQAGRLVQPYTRSHGSTWSVASGIAAITVRATPSELAEVRQLLRNFDNGRSSTCQAGAGGPSPTTPVLAGEKVQTARKKIP